MAITDYIEIINTYQNIGESDTDALFSKYTGDSYRHSEFFGNSINTGDYVICVQLQAQSEKSSCHKPFSTISANHIVSNPEEVVSKNISKSEGFCSYCTEPIALDSVYVKKNAVKLYRFHDSCFEQFQSILEEVLAKNSEMITARSL